MTEVIEMKKLLGMLLALALMLCSAALADYEVFTAPDGTQFYGMTKDGEPMGFIAMRQPSGDKLMFGLLRQGQWQGSLYTVVLDETGAFIRLIIQNYAEGRQQAALHCMADGRLTLFSYTDGEMTGMIVRDADGATAYTVKDGAATAGEAVAVSSLAGTAMDSAGVTLHVQADDSRTCYAVLDDKGGVFAAVQVHADGSVVASRNFDGECLAYSVADNTCTLGVMQDGAWAPGAVVLHGDGSTTRLE